MIIYEFDTDIVNGELIYWLGTTSVTGVDEKHTNQIYEQLDAELAFNI